MNFSSIKKQTYDFFLLIVYALFKHMSQSKYKDEWVILNDTLILKRNFIYDNKTKYITAKTKNIYIGIKSFRYLIKSNSF